MPRSNSIPSKLSPSATRPPSSFPKTQIVSSFPLNHILPSIPIPIAQGKSTPKALHFPGKILTSKKKTNQNPIMSGGVGPTASDISLPKEEEHEHVHPVSLKPAASPPARGGFLSFRQLNALAVMIITSASGMVSPGDFLFVIFSFIYIHFLSRVAFSQPNPTSKSRVFDPRNKTLRLYVFLAAIIGLFAPIAYIFEGIFEGDLEGIKAAVPHVFLLASQVFMEGIGFSDRFTIPIGVFVPVFYNSRRLFTIVDWLRAEVGKAEEGYQGSVRRLVVGRALAVANMAFWSFNLFGFLLPVYLPRAFRKYYVGSKVKD